MTIQAIETKYKGYRFRSRLEARWAIFFDTCGIPYVYEEQGFTLPDGNYLPNFWLPEQQYYVEIKGVEPSDHECHLASQLADITGKRVHIFSGDLPRPEAPDYDMYTDDGPRVFFPGSLTFYDRPNMWDWKEKGMPPKGYEDPSIEIEFEELSPAVLTELVKLDRQLSSYREEIHARAHMKVKHLEKQLTAVVWSELSAACELAERSEWEFYVSSGGSDHPYPWGQCSECGKFSTGYSGWDERLACKGGCNICMAIARRGYWRAFEKEETYHTCPLHSAPLIGCYSRGKESSWAAPRLVIAYQAARSARFEHGETPKVPRGKPR